MSRYTSISLLLNNDVSFLKEVLRGTRFKLTKKQSDYYAITYGETKTPTKLLAELESELASLGAYVIDTQIYYEPPYSK